MFGHTEIVNGGPAATSLAPLPVVAGRKSARERMGDLWRREDFRSQFSNRLNALYDSARTTSDNERYWANADSLSPGLSISREVRAKLRSRSRYEIANNSFACGMLETLAADIVGAGPRLNISDPAIERSWRRWSRAISLGAKLRTHVKQKKGNDGEGILVMTTNRALRTPAKLDLIAYEADQMTTPWRYEANERREADGIDFDQYGNPTVYHFLKEHPGGNSVSEWSDTVPVAADRVLHWFRADRPGQTRGIPELTPALALFANLRRFTMATIAAAETAASYAAVMHTDQAIDVAELDPDDFLETVPIEYRGMLTLPDGWSMKQFQAEHPTTTFTEFQRAIITEMARCWSMPRNIAAGDSADMTYSSGQLDHLIYWQAITVERAHLTDVTVEPVFEAWLREHLSEQSFIRQDDIDLDQPEYDHEWIWPVRQSRDPLKDAQAAVTLFDRGLMVDEQWWIEQGFDPQRMWDMLKNSIETREKMGAPVPGVVVTNQTTEDESVDNEPQETT